MLSNKPNICYHLKIYPHYGLRLFSHIYIVPNFGMGKCIFINYLKNNTILLQKRALRLINKVQKIKILKINDFYEYQIILFINNLANKNLPNSFNNIFKYNCYVLSSCPTRQSHLKFIERCNSTFQLDYHSIFVQTYTTRLIDLYVNIKLLIDNVDCLSFD